MSVFRIWRAICIACRYAEVIFSVQSLTETWIGKPSIQLYSDGTVMTTGDKVNAPYVVKKGEWRFIDGELTLGIEGNSIYHSTYRDGNLYLTAGWLGGLYQFEISEEALRTALNGNHGLVDRFDWVGAYR